MKETLNKQHSLAETWGVLLPLPPGVWVTGLQSRALATVTFQWVHNPRSTDQLCMGDLAQSSQLPTGQCYRPCFTAQRC